MSLLLRLENSRCDARFSILVLDILSSMPPRQNVSNFASRFGFLRLITNPRELSGFKAFSGDSSLGPPPLQQARGVGLGPLVFEAHGYFCPRDEEPVIAVAICNERFLRGANR